MKTFLFAASALGATVLTGCVIAPLLETLPPTEALPYVPIDEVAENQLENDD